MTQVNEHSQMSKFTISSTNSSGHKEVAFFEHTCTKCSAKYSAPNLGDFSYGDFIFSCECGKEFTYFDMSSSAECKIVDLLTYINKTKLSPEMYRGFLAYCSDKYHSHRFYSETICQSCRSPNTSSANVNKKIGSFMIRNASYDNFLSLNIEEMIRKFHEYTSGPVEELIKKSSGKISLFSRLFSKFGTYG